MNARQLSLLVAVIPLVLSACFVVGFKEDRVREGSAYGLSIGESQEEVFERAVGLREAGEIAEIHRWPQGESHFEFSREDLESALKDSRWTMIVNPEWWNDSITLEFEEDRLVEIYRFRICCELP